MRDKVNLNSIFYYYSKFSNAKKKVFLIHYPDHIWFLLKCYFSKGKAWREGKGEEERVRSAFSFNYCSLISYPKQKYYLKCKIFFLLVILSLHFCTYKTLSYTTPKVLLIYKYIITFVSVCPVGYNYLIIILIKR